MKTKRTTELTLLVSFLCFFYCSCTNKNKAIFYEKDIVDAVHQESINEIFMAADGYKYSQNYKKAAEAFEQCLQQNLSIEDKQYAINQLIFSNLMMNEDAVAKSWLDKTAQENTPLSKTALADYSYNVGVWAYHTSQPKMAEDYLRQALGLYRDIYNEKHLKFGRCLASLGVMLYEFSHTPDSSFVYLPKALEIFQNNPKLRNWSAECLLGNSMVSSSKRRYDEMVGFADDALTITNSLPFKDNILAARSYVFKARGLNMRRFKAETTEEKQKWHREIVACFENAVAVCPKASNRLQECCHEWLRYYARLDETTDKDFVAHFQQKFSEFEPFLNKKAGFHNYLQGLLYSNIEKIDSSIYYLRQFSDTYQRDSSHNRLYLTEVNVELLNNYEVLAEQRQNPMLLDSALYYSKMNLLNYANEKDTEKSWDDIIKPAFYNKASFQFVPLSTASLTFFKKYQGTGDIKSLKKTLEINKIIDQLLFSGITSQDDDAYSFFQINVPTMTYGTGLKAATIAFDKTQNRAYLDDVFRFGERVRSFLLYRDADSRRDTLIVTPPQYLRDSLKRLESDINLLKWSRERGGNSDIPLMQKQNQREQLFETLKTKYPQYYRLKVVQPIPTVQEVQKTLTEHQCLVQFTFTDKSLFAFFIGKNSFSLNETPWDTVWNKKIIQYCNYLNGEDKQMINVTPKQYAAMATEIYAKLFEKLPSQFNGCQELIIEPDRVLNALPFEALVETVQNEAPKFNNLPYLVQRFPITYTPSWKMYEMNRKALLPQKPTLRAYTYDFSSNELKSAKKEIDELTHIFGQNASCAIGKECTKQRFLADTNGHYDILHFSLHAKSDPLSKQDNKIFFAPKKGDIVYGFDLLKRHFSEKLVFISSCQSAYGKIATGEGAYSLSRSFIRAGATCVVASLWSISDETTQPITTYFYENIFYKRQIPSQALYNAKLSYLRQAKDSYDANPRFWAGLVCWD